MGFEEMEELMDDCECVEDDDEPLFESVQKSKRIHKKNLETIRTFLGGARQQQVSVIRPRYYSDLLAWALKHYMEAENWKIIKAMGHDEEAPTYATVNIDYGKKENLITRSYLLLERNDNKVVVSVKINYRCAAQVVVIATRKKVAQEFAKGLGELAQGKNLYQGKKIEFGGNIDFLNLPVKGWDDLALEPTLKEEIKTNTVGFLDRREEMAKYGIPLRRGVMLAGEPGTGKTLINKIIMNESPGITCIAAWVSHLVDPMYIFELYDLAKDLKPSIVFMEDIDLIGENRRRMKSAALPTLLAKLDGIEECTEVITIATTNFLEDIDNALRKRPSRFDRIIPLSLPSLEQRRDYIRYLAQKIPMTGEVQEYMAYRTEGLTPAQIQEVAYSLVIEHKHTPQCRELVDCCQFSKEDVDKVLVLVKQDRKSKGLGFLDICHNGERLAQHPALNSKPEAENKGKGDDNNV